MSVSTSSSSVKRKADSTDLTDEPSPKKTEGIESLDGSLPVVDGVEIKSYPPEEYCDFKIYTTGRTKMFHVHCSIILREYVSKYLCHLIKTTRGDNNEPVTELELSTDCTLSHAQVQLFLDCIYASFDSKWPKAIVLKDILTASAYFDSGLGFLVARDTLVNEKYTAAEKMYIIHKYKLSTDCVDLDALHRDVAREMSLASFQTIGRLGMTFRALIEEIFPIHALHFMHTFASVFKAHDPSLIESRRNYTPLPKKQCL